MGKIGIRLWVLIIAIFLALLSLSPSFEKGVVIKSVKINSTAYDSGLRQGMIIKQINSIVVSNMQDYSDAISEVFISKENKTKLIINTKQGDFIFFDDKAPEIVAGDIPKTKIKTGLDLSGGARALVKPVNVSLSSNEINDLIAITSERFNVYGLSDITIRQVKDLEGNNFMLVEIAGATPSDLEELVAQQGKFEAKVGNETVFVGGESDISDVCRNDAKCSGIRSCDSAQGGYVCSFEFVIYLTEKAAKKHASITENLTLDESGQYLSKKLYLFVDDKEVDSLFISKELKGQVTTAISIRGSGSGTTQQEAFNTATQNMNKLQTILLTGSLPYKLEIEKLDTISPVLGKKFTNYIFLAGIASLLCVSVIVFVRYRKIKSSVAVLVTSFSEVLLILGIASLIKWNLDLPSIAGILTVIGTGVDQQIIILDESHQGRSGGMIEKLKRALFIIVGAYFTSLASLIPLYWAGAGLLKGFAVTTIIGITTAVLITRPAFAEIIKKIEG